MRLVVDLTVCQGYAQCAFLAPDAFRFVGEEALMYDPQPDESPDDQKSNGDTHDAEHGGDRHRSLRHGPHDDRQHDETHDVVRDGGPDDGASLARR